MRRLRWVALALLSGNLIGCADTFEMVSSKRYRKDPFYEPFRSVDPMTVVTNPAELEPDERAKAMRALKEPAKDGRGVEQERVIATLREAATKDMHGNCRLAAIEALGKFDDPRAEEILLVAYQTTARDNVSATEQTPGIALASLKQPVTNNFSPEQIGQLQCRTLESLGARRSKAGLAIIVEAARTKVRKKDPKAEIDVIALSAEELTQADVRQAALRALENYRNDPVAISALIQVLQTERDVALRGRAHASLMKITGINLPPDADAWVSWQNDPKSVQPIEENLIQQVGGLFR